MLQATELLECLANLFRVAQVTAARYERDCPGAAECGYWSRDERDAYERARAVLFRAYNVAKKQPPPWLLESQRGETLPGRGLTDSGLLD